MRRAYPTHSQAMKNVTSAPAWPMSSGRVSAAGTFGQALATAATKAAANSSRPSSGVGGDRSSQ